MKKIFLMVVMILCFGKANEHTKYCLNMEQKYFAIKIDEVASLITKYPNHKEDLQHSLYYTQGFVFGYCVNSNKILSYSELEYEANKLLNIHITIKLQRKR